jgi:hypothetical protein
MFFKDVSVMFSDLIPFCLGGIFFGFVEVKLCATCPLLNIKAL